MKENGYVNFNFLDSKPNMNNVLVGLDLDYSNKVIAPDGHELALIAFMPIENLLTIAPQFKTDFQDKGYKDKVIYVFSYYDKEDYFLVICLLALSSHLYISIRKLFNTVSILSFIIFTPFWFCLSRLYEEHATR